MANMPKRRKSKDNPYILDYIYEEEIYSVTFTDGSKTTHNIKISKQVFEALNEFELEDISQLHKIDKHIENISIDNTDYTDIVLYHFNDANYKSVFEQVEEKLRNEELYKVIELLSDNQKRRIKMYYFEGLTQQQIADIEGTSLRAIQYTLNSAIEKLKENLKKI